MIPLEAFWTAAVAAMLAAYLVLDGLDLGAGIVHLFVARGDAERRAVLKAVGPVWDGNEVWLIAAGGTLMLAFPKALAAAGAGLYLPIILLLWLLVFRGLAVECRDRLSGAAWRRFWDTSFAFASLLVALVVGAAAGAVVRGLSFWVDGTFEAPLFGAYGGVLDAFTLLVGAAVVLALAHHGALWIAVRTEGPLAVRALGAAADLWPAVLSATIVVAISALRLQPLLADGFAARPWAALLPAASVTGLVLAEHLRGRGEPERALFASSLYIGAAPLAAAAALYPNLLPSIGVGPGLTAAAAAAPEYALLWGFLWWLPGVLVASGWFVVLYRNLGPKIRPEG